jgi:hypothetical protein
VRIELVFEKNTDCSSGFQGALTLILLQLGLYN